MKKAIISAVAAIALATSSTAWAGNWYIQENAFGVFVKNDETGESFKATSKKAAKKQAKRLNKIEDKQEKKEGDGVWDDGSRACNEPNSQVLC